MSQSHLIFRAVIYGLLVLTFCLGLPSFHYATALIVAVLLRHKDDPQALFKPVRSFALDKPSREL